MFVALEIMSVALYGLAGIRRDRTESQESALKYFITGTVFWPSSSMASLSSMASREALASTASPRRWLAGDGSHGLALLGIGSLIVGFGFKVATAPFHRWAPDVYEGAPTPVTAFMAAGVKAAAFAALLRVFVHGLPAPRGRLEPMGPARRGHHGGGQRGRARPDEPEAHARLLVHRPRRLPAGGLRGPLGNRRARDPLLPRGLRGRERLGGFGTLAALAKDGREPLAQSDVNGLAHRRPALAAALTVFLISLTGIPISAGFMGKFYLFGAAVGAGYVSLALVGVVMSVAVRPTTTCGSWSPCT